MQKTNKQKYFDNDFKPLKKIKKSERNQKRQDEKRVMRGNY